MTSRADQRTGDHASEVLAALDACRQIPSISGRDPGFGLPEAYRVTAEIRARREQRGERPIGRKIGFTNTTIWEEYDVHAPIWGHVYDTTRQEIGALTGPVSLEHLVEPRIEPEIMFGLGRAPEPGMDEQSLMGCIDWVSHGFEIVQSLFTAWRFSPADTVAAFGLHGALLVGARVEVVPGQIDAWCKALRSFEITLYRDGSPADRGPASNVLGGGPLKALSHLVDLLAADPDNPPVAAGEIISTGTVTRAFPIAPGETWNTRIDGLPVAGISVAFA